MNEKTTVTKLDPIQLISNILIQNVPECKGRKDVRLGHIKFDKDIVPQYHIIDSSTHDGTLMFTMELINKSLLRLINKKTCYIPTKPADELHVKDIKYTIGEIELKSEFGMKDLKCGRYSGQTDIISIPVSCEYIF